MSSSVLFRRFPLPDIDALAPVIRQVYGGTDYDARNRIRKGWGFLDRDADASSAQRLQGALGDKVLVIDNGALRFPGDPLTMTGFEAVPEGLIPCWQSPHEPERLVPWSEMAAVAAGGFAEEVVQRDTGGGVKTGRMLMGLGVFAVTGLPTGLLGGRKEQPQVKKTTRLITFGCILTRQGEQLAFSPDKFDFAGLSTAKQLSTTANFRVLVQLVQGMSSARLNLGAQYLLENKSLTLANYQSLEDFETELLWLLNTG